MVKHQGLRIVLLPGMDGTGILFRPFIEAAPPDITLVSVVLKSSEKLSYKDHARDVAEILDGQPTIIVAESYSGMIAYELLRIGCGNIIHIVFVASFISRPSSWSVIARYVPVGLLRSRWLFKPLMGRVLFKSFYSEKLMTLFNEAMAEVEANVLKQRLIHVSHIKTPDTTIDIPCTYLRPVHDYLVSRQALEQLSACFENTTIYTLAGTHFILQTNPKGCWQVIMPLL